MASQPFVPPIQGVNQEGVFTLRTIEDAQLMKMYAQGARWAVAIGGGLLRLETARALRLLGLEVTVVALLARLLPRQFHAQGAAVLTRLIVAMGLQVITGAATQAIVGHGRTRGMILKSGETMPGELILILGEVRSNVSLAQKAGLTVNQGVVVDHYLRTRAEEVYTAGDVAGFEGRVCGIIPAAIEQARVAEAHMAGDAPEPYRGAIPPTL